MCLELEPKYCARELSRNIERTKLFEEGRVENRWPVNSEVIQTKLSKRFKVIVVFMMALDG